MKAATVNLLGSVGTVVSDRQEQRRARQAGGGSVERGAVVVEGGDRGLPPVLFAHGRNGHPADFAPLFAGLRAEGLANPFCTVAFGENSELPVAEEAALVAAAARRAREFLGCPRARVDVVGFSKGGLSAVRAAADAAEGGEALFGRVVTVGSPLRGTAVAVWPFVGAQAAADMGPGAPACRALEARAAALGLELYHAFTPWDHLVTPAANAWYPATPRARVYACEGKVSHLGLPADPGVARRVAAWLRAAES